MRLAGVVLQNHFLNETAHKVMISEKTFIQINFFDAHVRTVNVKLVD